MANALLFVTCSFIIAIAIVNLAQTQRTEFDACMEAATIIYQRDEPADNYSNAFHACRPNGRPWGVSEKSADLY